MFLKSGAELEALIHQSIDETIQIIFQHNRQETVILPNQITSKINTEFAFFKFFNAHKRTTRELNESWCHKLFEISKEYRDDLTNFNTFGDLICDAREKENVTKTFYRRIKPSICLFFYMLWRNKALLLPFDYAPPKFRTFAGDAWAAIGLAEMPETLRLILNTFEKNESFGSLEHHYKSSLTSLQNNGYRCIVATNWHSIEDIYIDEVIAFKSFYSSLRSQNPDYGHLIQTLPFIDLLKSYLSYAPLRCNYKANELENLVIKPDNSETGHLLKSDDYQFKANLSTKPLFLLKHEALERAVSLAYKNTKIVLLSRLHQQDMTQTYDTVTVYPQAQLSFLKIFPDGFPASVEAILQLYDLFFEDYIRPSDLKQLVGANPIPDSWGDYDSMCFLSSVSLFFLELYNAEAILLPLDFELLHKDNMEYCNRKYSELLRIFLKLEPFSKPQLSACAAPSVLYKVILACNWRKLEDVTYDDAFEFQRIFQSRRVNAKARLPLLDVLTLLLYVDPKRCQYSLEDLSHVISDTPAASLLKSKTKDSTEKGIGFKWKLLINQYLEERRARFAYDKNHKHSLSKLLQYISVDLPREFGETSELIPRTPNEFKRYHLVGNNFINQSLIHKLRSTLSNTSFNMNLRTISAFFTWIIDCHYDDPDVINFKNPISELDFLNAPRRNKTDKKAFLGSQFSYVHSFFSSVCEFYWYLITEKKFIEGGPSRRALYDTQQVGFVPIVMIDGCFYPLYFVPSNLTNELMMGQGETLKQYPVFQTLFENLVALETALRHKHIRWLDRDKFDISADSSKNTYISELLVNYALIGQSDSIEVASDKVKTVPWQPYVSSRVINLLRRLRAFQDYLSVEIPSLWYDEHPDSIHGKIKPLFCTLDATQKIPSVISEEVVSRQYQKMLFFFDLLIQLSDINDVELLGITPEQSLEVIENARENLEQSLDTIDLKSKNHNYYYSLWKTALKKSFYYSRKYETEFTPHGTRGSVASERVKVLPPEAIKEFITGHESTAILSYYIQLDPEYLSEVGKYNQLLLLSDDYSKQITQRKVSENTRLALQATLKSVIEQDPSLLVRDFGAMSFSTEDINDQFKSGLRIINITPVSNLAFMPTHICPFGGKCPDEIKQDVGEMQCGQCYYSIKTVDHLPRILAEIRKLFDELTELRESAKSAKNAGADKAALQKMEVDVFKISRELAAWVYTAEILQHNLRNLNDRNDNVPQDFFVAKPDMLLQHFEAGRIQNNEISNLLLRIQDAKTFKEYFTPQLKSQISKIRKKLLIKERDFESLINEPTGYDLLDEFRGILRAYVESRGITLEEAAKQLAEPLKINKVRGGTQNFLEVLNV